MTQEELARKVGYSDKSMICKIESGIVEVPLKKIPAFARALETTPLELMGWEEDSQTQSSPLTGIAIPVYNMFLPGDEEAQMRRTLTYEMIPSSWKGEFFALRIQDNACAPVFREGELVIIRKQDTARSGSFVLAADGKNPASLMRFFKTRQNDFLLPVQAESATGQLKEQTRYGKALQICGKVVEVRRKL